MTTFNPEQKLAMHVLAFMLFRMGQEERARILYDALRALAPENQPDRLALAGLAAIAIGRGQGAEALEYLRTVLDGAVLPTRQSVFYLMKAQAMWLAGRREEARSAMDEYLVLNSRGRIGA
ncbi:MAG: hypothetical protein J6I40_06690 [Mailhella sp.]|nr:hypothetical protein [Mailhella sp.]